MIRFIIMLTLLLQGGRTQSVEDYVPPRRTPVPTRICYMAPDGEEICRRDSNVNEEIGRCSRVGTPGATYPCWR